MNYYPEGYLLDTQENQSAIQSPSGLAEAMREGRILEARTIICDSTHNLIVDLHGIKGIIPREEGAVGIREGTVRDIAMISRVNRPVSFVVTELLRDEKGVTTAMLSRRKAQERCMEEYLSKLCPGDVIPARITHLEPFGAFADIGWGVGSPLPLDSPARFRIDHPRERFWVGMDIRAVVKSIENRRITLSHKELLGTWEENASAFAPGETVAGVVRSVEPYGIFVELTPNLAGLAEPRDGVSPGQQASVFIKSIVPSRMKMKLIIIETFDSDYRPTPPNYYFSGEHMDSFLYSPVGCEKRIETRFSLPEETPPFL